MSSELQRAVGRVESTVKHLDKKVHDMDNKLDAALAYISEQKGASRRTVFISSGASAVVAAVIGWAVAWFR